VGPFAGVLFTPLVLAFSGLDVDLVRGRVCRRRGTPSVAGSLYLWRGQICVSCCARGGYVAGRVSGGPPRLDSGGRRGVRWVVEVGRVGFVCGWLYRCLCVKI